MGDHVISGSDIGHYGPVATATRWWVFLATGIAAVVVGAILLFNPEVAVGTLAVLVALGLVLTGVGELAATGRYRTTWTAVSAVALIVAGVLAAIWPDITLWAIAVLTGLGLLISGAARLVAAVDRPIGWGWVATGGVMSLAIGILALIWPGATVLVLALLLGIRMVIFGAAEISFALTLRDYQHD